MVSQPVYQLPPLFTDMIVPMRKSLDKAQDDPLPIHGEYVLDGPMGKDCSRD